MVRQRERFTAGEAFKLAVVTASNEVGDVGVHLRPGVASVSKRREHWCNASVSERSTMKRAQ